MIQGFVQSLTAEQMLQGGYCKKIKYFRNLFHKLTSFSTIQFEILKRSTPMFPMCSFIWYPQANVLYIYCSLVQSACSAHPKFSHLITTILSMKGIK
jgi:hypothetical protein